MLIESLKPLRVHLRGEAVDLIPGRPTEIADDDGLRLLSKAPDAVRQISIPQAHTSRPIDINPVASDARPIYWETGNGRILGPATPEFLARDGDTFWIVTTFETQIRWINADQLRSKKAFEQQRDIQVVEQVRF